MLYVGQKLIRAYVCMQVVVLTMPTLNKTYSFIYLLFIYYQYSDYEIKGSCLLLFISLEISSTKSIS